MPFSMCVHRTNAWLCDMGDGSAGLELHNNVLSPAEQANMVSIIEDWVVQVNSSCLTSLLLIRLQPRNVQGNYSIEVAVAMTSQAALKIWKIFSLLPLATVGTRHQS